MPRKNKSGIMKTVNETYYAIRIGLPRRDSPYLMLGDDRRTPRLFMNREDAEVELPSDAHCKVVRVKITG